MSMGVFIHGEFSGDVSFDIGTVNLSEIRKNLVEFEVKVDFIKEESFILLFINVTYFLTLDISDR